MPSGFIPEEDQGYLFGVVQLPRASSLQQTDAVSRQIEDILLKTPGVEYVTSIVGFNLLSSVQSTYTGFFFITLEEWSKRKTPELQVDAIQAHINRELAALPKPTASFAFPPPAIPGVGTAGGVTFILEDRSGGDVEFIAKNTQEFMLAAKKRPELTNLFTTALWDVPQVYVSVDQAQAMIQGVSLTDAYQTLQTFLGGYFVNYFNRFGLQWQVYIQAEGDYRTDIDNLGLFYVANKDGDSVPDQLLRQRREVLRSRIHDALQYVSLLTDQRGGRSGLQHWPSHESPGGSFRRDDAQLAWASIILGCRFRSKRLRRACPLAPSSGSRSSLSS